ncbi:hypothetical protein RFI_08721 [Reticulomyxa filosa]|uniref:Uncharacterized protein n=1 Tax=Reticulomyxa filosa TaxID=46433 RepID=X6NR89_RETFI|nr:hypothetical protein RFI_08721 [Reticulomyxa filosa]|eukprot:ETO28413.1 hypothetical protein RFI_08721 [Reticulomyxa filosa]
MCGKDLGASEQLQGSPFCLSLKSRLAEAKLKTRFALYDLVLCLLEWAAPRYRPIVIAVDQFQWLREDDWDLTRRLCGHVREGILQQVSVFISSQPMDNARYKPHFISDHLVEEYQKLRSDYAKENKLVPHSWGEQKTKAFIKTQFDSVRDVSSSLVELVHGQCGGYIRIIPIFFFFLKKNIYMYTYIYIIIIIIIGRPGFNKCFVELLKENSNYFLDFEEMREKGEKRLKLKNWIENTTHPHMLRFPIPSEVLGVTLRQLDVLSPEQSLCLKTCASLCVAEGYQCLTVRESVVRAVHPVEIFRDVERVRSTLKTLCMMKFIHLEEDDNAPGATSATVTQADAKAAHTPNPQIGVTPSASSAIAANANANANAAIFPRRCYGGYRASIFVHGTPGVTVPKHRRYESTTSAKSNHTYTGNVHNTLFEKQ